MADLRSLEQLKEVCIVEDFCEPYHSRLEREDMRIDTHATADMQMAIAFGVTLAIIGLIMLLASRSSKLKGFVAKSLPYLLMALVVSLVILVVFIILFIAGLSCIGGGCSGDFSGILVTVTIVSIIVLAVASRILLKYRNSITIRVKKLNNSVWLIIGLSLILIAASYTFISVQGEYSRAEVKKIQLRSLDK